MSNYYDRSVEQLNKLLRREAIRVQADNHPCNRTPCVCECIHCQQARKYNQSTHCRGRKR